MTARVAGLDALRSAFKELGQDMEKGPLRRATRAVGRKVATLAKSKAPRGDGDLAKSIKVIGLRERTAKERGYVAAVVVAPVGVPYAHIIETGSEKQAAQPYLRPAADEVGANIAGAAREALQADLAKLTRKAAKVRR